MALSADEGASSPSAGRGAERGPRVELTGSTALVAGASRGIGLAIARALGRAGANIWMVARSPERLTEAASTVGARHLAVDVSDESAVEQLRDRLVEEGPVDVVISAMGSFALAPAHEIGIDEFDAMLAANLRAPFLLTRAFLPDMLERGRGHILTLGSIAGRMALPGNAAYSASKFGVRGFHAVLAAELKGTGVRATLVEPAATDTPLWDPLEPDADPGLPSRVDMMEPDDVADAVIYAITRPAGVAVPNLLIERS